MHSSVRLALLLTLVVPGCGRGRAIARSPQPEPPSSITIKFTDITQSAGIRFTHNNGAFGGKLLPETMGSGLAFLDFDGDLDPDLFVVNGRDWAESEVAAFKTGGGVDVAIPHKIHQDGGTGRLYQNNGDGTFTDVTAGSGIDLPMFGMGVAAGDYDNDGDPDLFVTAVGRNYLFRNIAPGQFADVSESAGVSGSGWNTSAAFLDYDRDGNLDLFVCRYVKWSPAGDIFTSLDGKIKHYTTPEQYVGETCKLYKNVGGGRFRDVSDSAGISIRLGALAKSLVGKSLGIAITDVDSDGWPDIAVANDTEPNFLFKNNGRGVFEEIGAQAGIAFSETGSARSARGVDSGEVDDSGRESLVFSNFTGQPMAIYRNQGARIFADSASESGFGPAAAASSAFGSTLLDLDNDGTLDLLTVNGHLDPDIATIQPDVKYAQSPTLFRNLGSRFADVNAAVGSDFARPIVGRGLACADIDLDGDLDIAVTTNGGPLYIFRNEGGSPNNSIRLILDGSKSNRSGIGAAVEVRFAGKVLRRTVRSGSSYLSQSDLPLTIGLGPATLAESLTIKWPSGATSSLSGITTGQILRINESSGFQTSQPFYGSR